MERENGLEQTTAPSTLRNRLSVTRDVLESCAIFIAAILAPFAILDYLSAQRETKTNQALSVITSFLPVVDYQDAPLFFDQRWIGFAVSARNDQNFPVRIRGRTRDIVSCNSKLGVLSEREPFESTVMAGGADVFTFGINVDALDLDDGRYYLFVELQTNSPLADEFIRAYDIEIENILAPPSGSNVSNSLSGVKLNPPMLRDSTGLVFKTGAIRFFQIENGNPVPTEGFGCVDDHNSDAYEQHLDRNGMLDEL